MRATAQAALAGLATGARSQSVLAAYARRSPPAARRLRQGAVLAALGELVIDKLPVTPSRVMPVALGVRLALGAVAGGLVAHRAREHLLVGAVTGAAGAGVASVLGARTRDRLAARFGADLPGALLEDAAAYGLATLVARR